MARGTDPGSRRRGTHRSVPPHSPRLLESWGRRQPAFRGHLSPACSLKGKQSGESAVCGQRAAGRKWGLPAAPRPRRLARRGRLFAPQPSAWLAVAPKRLRAPSLARPPSKALNLLLYSLPSRTFAPQIVNASGPTTPGPPTADARAQRSAHCSPAAGAARPAGQPPVHSPTQ